MSPQKILVVEDDIRSRRLFADALAPLHVEVVQAASYAEGIVRLQALRERDVVLADQLLLNGHGIDLLKEARKKDVGGCLVTEELTDELLDEARDGGWVVMQKPVDASRLRAHLTHLLSCASLFDSRMEEV